MIFTGTKNFSLQGDPMLACPRSGMLPEQDFMEKVQIIRDIVAQPLKVNSGARSRVYNNEISDTGFDGPHTTGRAIDLGISGELAFKVVAVAIYLGFTGIGIGQKGEVSKRLIHLDDLPESPNRPRPRIWSY